MYIRTHKKGIELADCALQDTKISWQAKGLLIYLLCLPDDKKISILELKNNAINGKSSTANIINELIEAGYIQRIRLQNKNTGKFEGYEYRIKEL